MSTSESTIDTFLRRALDRDAPDLADAASLRASLAHVEQRIQETESDLEGDIAAELSDMHGIFAYPEDISGDLTALRDAVGTLADDALHRQMHRVVSERERIEHELSTARSELTLLVLLQTNHRAALRFAEADDAQDLLAAAAALRELQCSQTQMDARCEAMRASPLRAMLQSRCAQFQRRVRVLATEAWAAAVVVHGQAHAAVPAPAPPATVAVSIGASVPPAFGGVEDAGEVPVGGPQLSLVGSPSGVHAMACALHHVGELEGAIAALSRSLLRPLCSVAASPTATLRLCPPGREAAGGSEAWELVLALADAGGGDAAAGAADGAPKRSSMLSRVSHMCDAVEATVRAGLGFLCSRAAADACPDAAAVRDAVSASSAATGLASEAEAADHPSHGPIADTADEDASSSFGSELTPRALLSALGEALWPELESLLCEKCLLPALEHALTDSPPDSGAVAHEADVPPQRSTCKAHATAHGGVGVGLGVGVGADSSCRPRRSVPARQPQSRRDEMVREAVANASDRVRRVEQLLRAACLAPPSSGLARFTGSLYTHLAAKRADAVLCEARALLSRPPSECTSGRVVMPQPEAVGQALRPHLERTLRDARGEELPEEGDAAYVSPLAVQACTVSVRATRLVEMLHSLLELASWIGHEAAASILYCRARDLVDAFVAVAPSAYDVTVPHVALLLHNDALYIATACLSLVSPYAPHLPPRLAASATLIDLMPALRETHAG